MVRRYSKMFFGNSYWHLDQGPGKHFVPGELLGYYNDLSGKVWWNGPVDEAGVPLNWASDGQPVHFPITILQKALAHWDTWLGIGGDAPEHRAAFLQLARWALNSQDESGGWETWTTLGLESATPYSAMTQGEGISVLVRAFSATGEQAYLEGARQALPLLITPLEKGGTSWLAPEGLVLEEVPLESPKTILNGWIFAFYGIYDLQIVDNSPEVQKVIESTLNALLAYLHRYDAGFWSYYDTSGNLASPFYHRLHIAQLKVLELTYPERARSFGELRKAFEGQLASRTKRTKAVALKGCQKLRNPPKALMP
jgi:hypothetical protein